MWESRLPIVTALVGIGKANVNFVKDGTCLTALHWAALNDDSRVVDYLLKQGASMKFSNFEQTPIDVAGICTNLQVSCFIVIDFRLLTLF